MSSIFFYLASKRQQTLLGNANAATAAAGMARKELLLIPISDSEVTRPFAPKCNDQVPVIDQRTRRMLTTGLTTASEDVYQVDVAFLSYVENGDTNAHVRLDSITFATVAELIAHEEKKRKEKAKMSKNAYKHFKWVNLQLNLFIAPFIDKYPLSSLPVHPSFEGRTDLIGSEQEIQDRSLAHLLQECPCIHDKVRVLPRNLHNYCTQQGALVRSLRNG